MADTAQVIDRMYLGSEFKNMEIVFMTKRHKYLVLFLIKGATRDVMYSVAFNVQAEAEVYYKNLDPKSIKEIISFLLILGERSKKV